MKVVVRAILCFVVFFLLTSTLRAQVIIQPTIPQIGIIQKSQLWNLLLISNLQEETEVTVDIVVQDRLRALTLFSARSGSIKLKKGPQQLTEQASFPIQYHYEALFNNSNGQALLPVGSYQICYSIIRMQKGDPVGQECVPIDISPLSPPQLIYPANMSQIIEHSPQLSWIPPLPTTLFTQLRYDILLMEIFPGQSPADAIQRNPPLFTMDGIPQQSIAYPPSASSLDTGKQYAWQIIAKNGESFAAKSEVWTFSLGRVLEQKNVSTGSFVKITASPSSPFYAHEGLLKLEYYNKFKDSVVNISITNIKEPNNVLGIIQLDVKYGQNFITYDLKRRFKLKESECYEARIITHDDEILSAKFYPKYSHN